jgi:hypothetical protein
MKKLKDFCDIKTNMPDADFWLVRKGNDSKVGMPTKVFNKEHIGIKVTDTQRLDKNYLFYMMMFFYSVGTFKNWAKGTLKLKHIELNDVKQITIGG